MKKLSLLMMLSLLCIGHSARSQWVCGQDVTDSRDSKVYKTILIGNQCWMAENLNYGNRINSTKQSYEMSDNGVVEKYCWHDSLDYCDGTNGKIKKGGFYEWKEAMQNYAGQPTLPVQGVCPSGWHIPSNAEWNTLLDGLGGSQAFQKMLKGGSSGFDALLTGYRCTMTGGYRTSAFNDPVEWRGYYWSSEQTDADNSPVLEIAASQLYSFSYLKSLGLSVRCIKNTSSSLKDMQNQGYEIRNIQFSADKHLLVEFDADRNNRLNYCILNRDGKVQITGEQLVYQGQNSLSVNFIDLAAGIYILRMNDQCTILYKKFFVE